MLLTDQRNPMLSEHLCYQTAFFTAKVKKKKNYLTAAITCFDVLYFEHVQHNVNWFVISHVARFVWHRSGPLSPHTAINDSRLVVQICFAKDGSCMSQHHKNQNQNTTEPVVLYHLNNSIFIARCGPHSVKPLRMTRRPWFPETSKAVPGNVS